jgi:hypothetical protein
MVNDLALGKVQGPGRCLPSRWFIAVSGKGDAEREIQVRLLAVKSHSCPPADTRGHSRQLVDKANQPPAAYRPSALCIDYLIASRALERTRDPRVGAFGSNEGLPRARQMQYHLSFRDPWSSHVHTHAGRRRVPGDWWLATLSGSRQQKH